MTLEEGERVLGQMRVSKFNLELDDIFANTIPRTFAPRTSTKLALTQPTKLALTRTGHTKVVNWNRRNGRTRRRK